MDYNKVSNDYDFLYSSKDYDRECKFIESVLGKRIEILDIGCGTGVHSSILASNQKRSITGIDISCGMIDKAREKYNKTKNLSFHCESLKDHFKKNKKYDAAIAMFNIVNHIDNLKELSCFFEDCANMLEEEGKIIFDCWNSIACSIDKPHAYSEKLVGDKKIIYKTNINLIESLCKTVISYDEKEVEIFTTLWSPKLLIELMKQNNVSVEGIYNFRDFNSTATEKDHRIIFVCKKQGK
tara:strand:+ start:15944 stop:16660 length:717 start_codon:yes stop_codon:yes gene_type:complete